MNPSPDLRLSSAAAVHTPSSTNLGSLIQPLACVIQKDSEKTTETLCACCPSCEMKKSPAVRQALEAVQDAQCRPSLRRAAASLRSVWLQILMVRRGRDSWLCATELRCAWGAKTDVISLPVSTNVEVAALPGLANGVAVKKTT